jgi:hypothetical protein
MCSARLESSWVGIQHTFEDIAWNTKDACPLDLSTVRLLDLSQQTTLESRITHTFYVVQTICSMIFEFRKTSCGYEKKLVNINIACTWVSIPLKYRKNVMRIGFSLSPHHACFFPVAKSIIPDSRACLLCMGCFSFSRCIAWWDRVLPSINSHGILIQHVGICARSLGKFEVEITGANLWVLHYP